MINKSESNFTLIFKKIIFGGLLISLLTPLIINVKAYFPFNFPRSLFFMATAQVIFFTWIFLITFNKNYRPKLNLITIILTLFILSLTLSTVFSVDPLTSFWSNHERTMGLLMYFHLYVFFLAVSSTFRMKKDWIKIFGFSSVVASIVSLIGIIDNFGIVSFGINFSGGSSLGNTSFMGSYLLINIFLAFYVFMKTREKWKFFYGVNLITIILGIVLSPGGRAMKGALLIGLIVFVLLYLAFIYRQKVVRILSRVTILLGLIFFITISLMAFQEGNIVREKIMSFRGMPGRFTVWEEAWQGFKEKPILGWGSETFGIVFLKNFNPKLFLEEYGEEVWFDRAHNVVFDSLVHNGLIGSLLFFGVFGAVILVSWRKYLNKKEIGFLIPLVFSSLFVAYFIQNLTVFDMISSYMLVFLSFAFIVSICCYGQEEAIPERKFNYLSLIILVPFLFSYSLFVNQPSKSNFLISTAFHINETTEEKISLSEEALESSPVGIRQIRRHIAERFLNSYQVEIENIKKEINEEIESITKRIELEKKLEERREIMEENFKFIKNELDKNISESPFNFRDFFLMGRLHNDYFDFHYLNSLVKINSEKDGLFNNEDEIVFREAEDWINQSHSYFEKAMELSPLNQQGYWHYAQSIISLGKIEILRGNQEKSIERFREAFTITKKIIELEPKVITFQLSGIRIANDLLMDRDLTDELIKEALEIDSSWEELLDAYK